MNRKDILYFLVAMVLLVIACQSQQSSMQKAQDKANWQITFGSLSNQPLPPDAQAGDYLQRAIDDTVITYWQSRTEAYAGMYLDLDLKKARKIHGVILDSSPRILSEDYPRGLVIFGATQEGQWKELFRDYNIKPLDGRVRMEFPPQDVRYLRLQLLGGAPNKWWSVAEIDLEE